MSKFKKYDLIFSIGQACSCTEMLRKCRLQFYSYPFDWLFGSTFLNRIKMLCDDMKTFINKEDLEFSYEARSISCSAYYNKATNIIFNHDFKKDLPFETAYPRVKEKYDRRIKRLYEQIEKSKNILVIYLQTPNTKDELKNEELLEGYELLKNKFGDKISILYLYCDETFDFQNRKFETINENVIKLKFNYNAYNEKLPYVVNAKILKKVFNRLKISNKFLTCENKRKRIFYLFKLFFKGELWKKI